MCYTRRHELKSIFCSFENNKGMFRSQSQDIYYFVKVTSIFFKITNTILVLKK